MMLLLFTIHFLLLTIQVKSVLIPFFNNSILKPVYTSNNTLIINGSCSQCLCYSNLSYPALNCFSNNSCQIFSKFPTTYRIEETPGARLYFPQQIFPNVSRSCTPNIDYLLNKLNTVNFTSTSVSNPTQLIMDNQGHLVTVDHSLNALVRLNTSNLAQIDSTLIQTTSQMAIGYNNGAFYVKAYSSPMAVIDSISLGVLNNFSLASVSKARDIMFLNNGQIMVITSYGSNSLVFFNQSNISPINYSYMSSQLVNYSGPYGMWRVNDSLFYVTSYDNYALYSYSKNTNGSWKETLLFKIANLTASSGVTFVTIDNNNRFWISLVATTTLIYDQQGNLLGNYTIPNSKISDIEILDNYVMYFADVQSDRIIRIDPNVQCD